MMWGSFYVGSITVSQIKAGKNRLTAQDKHVPLLDSPGKVSKDFLT